MANDYVSDGMSLDRAIHDVALLTEDVLNTTYHDGMSDDWVALIEGIVKLQNAARHKLPR